MIHHIGSSVCTSASRHLHGHPCRAFDLFSLFLALFLSVCLSYPLLFSVHFYLDPDLTLFLHVVSGQLTTGTPPTEESGPLAEFTPLTGRLVTYQRPEGRTIRVLFHACAVQKPILSLGCLAQQGYWSDLHASNGTLFFPDKIQTKHSQTQLHKEESLFFVKGMLVAPLSTAGVSDEVAQELEMPMGPQMLVLQHSKIQALLIK